MKHKLAWMVALSAGILAGCGAARPSKYYQLAVPGAATPVTDRNPFPVDLLIGPLRASHLYREDHIVYSLAGEQMGTYEYQRWAEPPNEMLQDLLIRELQASGRYRSVDYLRSNSRGDYILYGHLYDFKEVSGSPPVARLTIDVELHDLKTGTTVWTHYYTRDKPAGQKDISAVVSALDGNAQQGVAEIESSLNQYFSMHPVN